MCRIAGIVSLDCSFDFDSGLSAMLSSLVHGGPDDEGRFTEGKVAFGHRRLSVIDLSQAGHQPMVTDDNDLIISFNGEIYNYLELKTELELLGIIFHSHSDTEVLLHAYNHWGTSAFNRLEGMFAFSLYDKRKNSVLLVRDQIGVKPLYYFVNGQELIFASEVKSFRALRPEWPENEDWKILFLAFGSLPHPSTTLREVWQLAPGSYLELNLKDFSYAQHQYYSYSTERYTIKDTREALTVIEKSVEAALKKNLISDAPLGIFLSGGIDSSLLALLASKIEHNITTVSVNFEDATFDELPYQQLVLDKMTEKDHHSYKVTESFFWNNLSDIFSAMDQPSIDGVNSYFVSKCAREAGLKTVLSGLGADEIFGGYESVNRVKWLKKLRLLPFKRLIAIILGFYKKAAKRMVFLRIPGAVGDYLFLRGIFTPDSISSLLHVSEDRVWKVLNHVSIPVSYGLSDKEYASFLESRIYMTNQLLKDTDFMSMWHGVEVRVPFLDVVLLRKIHSIDPSIRYKRDVPKFLLTMSNSGLLPQEIIYRKKFGFTFPFSLWMKKNPEKFKDLIPEGNAVNEVVKNFSTGKEHWSKFWSLIVIKQFRLITLVNFVHLIDMP